MAEEILRKVDLDWLLSIYGSLLTEKQRILAAQYYEEDLSLAEIAEQTGVSRQSVHETLRRVESQLRAWEEKLGMRRRLTQVEGTLTEALRLLPEETGTQAARAEIEKALRLLTDEEERNGL